MSTFGRVVLLLALTLLAAIGHGLYLGPVPEEAALDSWSVSLEAARGLPNPLWVDSRPESAYATAHLPGAIRLDFDNWDQALGDLLLEWDPDRSVIVYCSGNGCESSQAIAARLREELGVDSIFWLEGGWSKLRHGDHAL
ncbi:MAG: rhodanese-like domain-containing protein [Oceanipulchritudo sp.]